LIGLPVDRLAGWLAKSFIHRDSTICAPKSVLAMDSVWIGFGQILCLISVGFVFNFIAKKMKCNENHMFYAKCE